MNTDPKNQERVEGLQLHPELAVPNTNPRKLYDVTVHRTDYRYTVVRVAAESEQDAEAKGEELAGLQPDADWGVADRDLYAVEAKQITEGSSHE